MSAQRDRIRPSLRQLSEADDELEYPPSAQVSRGVVPPSLAKAGTKTSTPGPKKSVRIAQPTEEDVRYFEKPDRERPALGQGVAGPSTSKFKQGRQVQEAMSVDEGGELEAGRFSLDLDSYGDQSDVDTTGSTQREAMPPVVGSVQERPRRASQTTQDVAALKSPSSIPAGGMSRFKAMRQADKTENSSARRDRSIRPSAPPSVRRKPQAGTQDADDLATLPTPSADPELLKRSSEDQEEQWLDENGQPMSAFRQARLRRQGLPPPGGFTRPRASSEQTRAPSPDVVTDSGDANDVAGIMRSIASENQAKVDAMKPEEVIRDLRDLEAMFGKDMLDGLRARQKGSDAEPARHIEDKETKGRGDGRSHLVDTSSQSPLPRVPDRPVGPLALFVFDHQGRPLPSLTTEKARHNEAHEGHAHPAYGHDPSDPSKEGYTLASLFLLARSAVAGQRVTSLGILNKVVAKHGAQLAFRKAKEESIQIAPGQIPDARVIATHFLNGGVYFDVALSAVALLSDRHVSVRYAALSTLRVVLLFGALQTQSQNEAASESETLAQPGQRLLDAGLMIGLGNILRGDTTEIKTSRDFVVEILIQLVEYDANVGKALIDADKGRLMDALIHATLKSSWPIAATTPSATALLPAPRAVHLLLAMVRSSRKITQTLVQRDSFDCLLRYVAVPPWSIAQQEFTEDVSLARQQSIGYDLLPPILALYATISQYGFYASLVSRAWDLFELTQVWTTSRIRTATSLVRRESATIVAFYRLLQVWTLCAIDPHQTTPEHEVTWSQVETWVDLSIDLLQSFPSDLSSRKDATYLMQVFAAAGQHLATWLEGAAVNAPEEHNQRISTVDSLIVDFGRRDDVSQFVLESLNAPGGDDRHEDSENEDDDAISAEEGFSAACEAAFGIILQNRSADSPYLEAGRRAVRQPWFGGLLEESSGQFRRKCLPFLIACCAQPATLFLAEAHTLLGHLRKGEEDLGLCLMEGILAAAGKDLDHEVKAPLPFYLECLGVRPNARMEDKRPLHIAPSTLQPSHLKRLISQRLDESNDDTDGPELDPVTQSVLWKCPASSGLPLRPDWPLLPLDDLLRSAEAAVLNRANNLPEEWDPNEREVVKETLSFACWYCEQILSARGKDQALRSLHSAHLELAAQKVFMLESGIQGDLRKWTGAVTGKDLFRDPSIAPLMGRLQGLANELSQVENVEASPTLEDLATLHFGAETTYYSFFTDFLGLYDSISFGDKLFARSLLPPLDAGTYAADYRRLVWKDYAHLLPTLRTPITAVNLRLLLRTSSAGQEDDDLIQAYVSALLGRQVAWEDSEKLVLPRMAVHHLAVYLWHEGSEAQDDATSGTPVPKRVSLAKGLLGQNASNVPAGLQKLLVQYDVQAATMSPETAGLAASDRYPESGPIPLVSSELARERVEWISSLI